MAKFIKGQPTANPAGRPKGSPNKDPDAIWNSKKMRMRIVFNMQERKRLEWVVKYFNRDLPDFDKMTECQAVKMSVNMMCEMAQHYEQGYDLYFDRKVGKKLIRRRIIIS